MIIPPLLNNVVIEQPYPLLFATISGAHLYGFASPDSDFDLRGVHVLPVDEVIGLDYGLETIENTDFREGSEIDLVTHDLKKFVKLMLKNNGYVLEQLFSPLVVQTSESHSTLKEIGKKCVTVHHFHHYLGFADSQWRLFNKENPPRVKPLLYVFRVLMTGIHLMRTGEIEANLLTLNKEQKLSFIDELIHKKLSTSEHTTISNADLQIYSRQFDLLRHSLEEEAEASTLPKVCHAKAELNEFLKTVRLQNSKVVKL
ncbi:MAG: nucleotidyltransferase domain-containing protein [Candidatus Obscuribacterales bacterium]|nr:nucleotidyltransferase domain-containing protein [Candidatus Obscuribacterales bacterium]